MSWNVSVVFALNPFNVSKLLRLGLRAQSGQTVINSRSNMGELASNPSGPATIKGISRLTFPCFLFSRDLLSVVVGLWRQFKQVFSW